MKEGESTSCGPKQEQKHEILAVDRTIMKPGTLIRALTPSRLKRAAADSNPVKKDTAATDHHKIYFKTKVAIDFRAA